MVVTGRGIWGHCPCGEEMRHVGFFVAFHVQAQAGLQGVR